MEVYEIIVVAFLVTFVVSIFLGYPIAWTLGGLSLLFVAGSIVLHDYFGVDTFLLTRWGNFSILIDRIFATMANWVLVALPMFVYMGLMLDRSGVAEKAPCCGRARASSRWRRILPAPPVVFRIAGFSMRRRFQTRNRRRVRTSPAGRAGRRQPGIHRDAF